MRNNRKTIKRERGKKGKTRGDKEKERREIWEKKKRGKHK